MEGAFTGWSEFHLAVAGAAAALTGLIIVAMSVNIERIMKSPSIPARAACALGALVLAVAVCCLALIPGKPLVLLGIETLVGSTMLWMLWIAQVRAVVADSFQGSYVPRVAIGVFPAILFTVGGVLLTAGTASGLSWLAAASVVSIIAGVLFSWVALVEILR